MSHVFDPNVFDGNVFDEQGNQFTLALAASLALTGHPLTLIELLVTWQRQREAGAFDGRAFDPRAFDTAPDTDWIRLFYT